MKRALSFLLSFAMMFSAFAPAVSAMEDIPSVASNEYGTVVYYAVNGDEQSGQVNGNTVYVNEMGMITFTANDENGEQLDIVGITVDPAAYRETNILDNGIAVVGVSEGASAEELYTVKVEVSDGTEATMYYVAKPNTPAVEPEQPTDDGVFDLESATVWIDYLGGSMTAAETLKGGIVPVRKGQSFAVYAVDADGTYTTKGNQFLGIVSDNGFEIMVEDYTEIDGCLGQLVTIPDDPSIGINAQGFSVGFISGAVQKWFNFNIEVGAAVNSYVLTGLDNALDATKLTGSHGMTQGSYCGIAFTVDDEYRDAANVDFYLSETMAAAGFSAERASGTLKDGTAVSFWNLYSDKTTPTGEYTATFEIWGEEFPVTINITKGNDGEIVEPEPGFSYTGQYTGSVYWRYAGESGWRELSTGKSYCAADTIKADVFQEIELQFIDDSEFVTDSIWFPNGDPEYMFEEFDYDNHILSLRTDSTAVLRNLKEGFAYQTDFAVNDGQRYIFQFTVQEEEVTLPATVFSGTAKIIVGSHDAPEYLDFNNFGAGASENNCLGVKFFDTNGAPVDANRVKPVISSLPAGIDIHWGYDNWTAENGSTGVYNEWEFWFNENIQPGSYDMQFVIDDSYTATVTLNVIEDSGEGPGAGGEEIEYFGDPHVYWWRGANMSEKDAVEYGWTSSDLEVIEISTDNTLFIRTKDSNGTIVPVNGWSFIDATDSDLAGLDWGENDFGDFVVIIGENAAPGQRTVKISNAMGEFVFCFEIVADEGGEGGDGDEGEENGYFDWAYGTSQMLPSSGKVTLEIVEFGPGNATGDVFVAKHIEDGDRFEILGDVYQSIISVDKNGNGGPLSCTVNIDLAREIYGESGDFWINLSLVTDNGPTQTWGFKIGGEDDDTPEEEPDNTDAPYAKWANGLESSDDFVVPQDSTFTAPIETGNITDQTVAVLLGYVDEETEGNPFVPFETQKGLSFTYDENGLPTSCTFDGEAIAQEYPHLASQGWFHVAIVITYKDGSKLTGGRDVEFPGENTGEGGLHLEWDLSDTDGEMTVQLINDYTAYNIIQTGSADTLGDGYVRVLLGYVDEDTMEFVPFNYSAGLYAYYDENNIPYKCEFNGAEIMEAFGAVYEGDYFHVAFVYFNSDHEIIATHGRDVPLVREGGEGGDSGDSGNTPPVVHTLFSVNEKAYDEMFLGDDITTFKGDAVYVKVYNATNGETFPVTAVTPDSGTTSTTGISWEILNDGTVKFNVGNNAAENNGYGFNLAAGGTSWGFALNVVPAYEGERVDAINTLYYLNDNYGGYYHEEEGSVSATHGDTVSFKTFNYATDGGVPVEEINFTETEGYTVYYRNNEVIVEIGSDAAEDLTVSAVVGGKTYNFKIELTVLEWWVNGDILFITGKGEMPNYKDESDHPWYDYRNSIRVIEFISGLTTINDSAFYGFSNLEEVTFSAPEGQEPSIRVIENNAFGNCQNLSEIILPDSLEELWGGAFSGSAITNINIPKNLTDIDVQAFSGMDALTNVSYDSANPVYKVHYGCIIENDTNIAMVLPYTTELYVPSYVTSIDGHAKVFAEQVTKISVLSDNTKYYAEDGVLFSTNYYGDKVIEWYPEGRSGTEYTIPRGTKHIAQFAFQRCNLEKLYVYAGIEEVDMSWAFSGAENLETIYFYGTEAQFNNTAFNVYEGVEVIRLDDPDAPLVDDGVFDATDATIYIEKEGYGWLTNKYGESHSVDAGDRLIVWFEDADGTTLKVTDKNLVTDVQTGGCTYYDSCTGVDNDILCYVLPVIEAEEGNYEVIFTIDGIQHSFIFYHTGEGEAELEDDGIFDISDVEIVVEKPGAAFEGVVFPGEELLIMFRDKDGTMLKYEDRSLITAVGSDMPDYDIKWHSTGINDDILCVVLPIEEVESGEYMIDFTFNNRDDCTYGFDFQVKALEIIDSGEFNSVHYDIYSNGDIVFRGSGNSMLGNGEQNDAPWAEEYGDFVRRAHIGEGITKIASWAFMGSDYIEYIGIGKDVEVINDFAFSNLAYLYEIEVDDRNETFKVVDGMLIGDNYGDTKLYIAEKWLWGEVWVPDDVLIIAPYAFAYSQVEDVIVGTDTEVVGAWAFAYCEFLESVIFRDSLQTVGMYAFAESFNLQTVAFPDTLTTLNDFIFEDIEGIYVVYEGTSDGFDELKEDTDLGITGEWSFCGTEGQTEVWFTNDWEIENIVEVSFDKESYRYGDIVVIETEILDDNYEIDYIRVSNKPIEGNKFVAVEDHWVEIVLKYNGPASGKLNKNIEWEFYENDGILLVYGEGTMPDFTSQYGDKPAPWLGFAEDIRHIVIEGNITSVGENAFLGLYNAEEAYLTPTIKKLGDRAFYECENIGEIELPENLEEIGFQAFAGTHLSEINIPAGVENITPEMFEMNANLKNIYVSDNNETYKDIDGVLYSKDGKTIVIFPATHGSDYEIPEGVTTIGDAAFLYAIDLNEVVIPDTVTTIGQSAFEGCYNLGVIEIPNSVTSIGVQALATNKWDGTDVIFDANNKNFCTEDGIVYQLKNGVKTAIIEGKHYNGSPYLVIPEGVTSIYDLAFIGTRETGITHVIMPSTMRDIGESVFQSVLSLEYVKLNDGLTTIPRQAFYECQFLETIIIPASVNKIERYAFEGIENLTVYYGGTQKQWNNALADFVFDYDYTLICNYGEKFITINNEGGFAFVTVNDMPVEDGTVEGGIWPGDEVVISDIDADYGYTFKGVFVDGEEISRDANDRYVFTVTDDHTVDVVFERGVAVSGKQGKLNWTIYIDGGLEITGSGAIPNLEPALDENEYFVNPHPWGAYADDVTSITVADTITSIGDCAFMNMWCAEEVTLGNKVNYIGDMAFANCQELREITLPDTVKTIGNRAFAFTQLSEITLPANLEMIKDFVFQDTDISEIVIPAKVKSIAPYFFTDMFNLDSFYIDEANTNLVFEDGIIWRISSGKKIAVVRAVERFVDSNLELVIPETVTAIENHAFAGCYISSVTLGSKVATIGASAFEYGWFDKVELGIGVKTIETGAFTGANIDEFVMGPNVTTIKAAAFGEVQFKELVMGNKVSKLEPYVFVDSELEKVVLSTALKAIPEGTFAGAENLKEVVIPKTVTTIDTEAFAGCDNLEYIYFGGTEVQWNKIKVAAGNEALENEKVLFEIAPGVCSIKVMDSNSGEDTAIAPLQNIKRYNDDINLMYAFEISKYKAGEIEWTVTSSNENVVQVVSVSDPWSYTKGAVEFETKDVELNVVGKGKAVVTFTAKDTLTNTTKTYKVTYNVTQMATGVELTVTGTQNRAGEYSIIAGKTLAPKIKWIGGNPWSAEDYSFNIETEESIEDGIPVVDPVKGTVTTYADTKYDKLGNITAYATEPGSYVLTFVAAAEDADGNIVCDIVENLPIHVYTEMASAVNVDRTKVILDPMAHETETIISAWVENEGQACGDVAFTWTANDNFLVVDNGDNNVYVKLLNNNKGSITITATAMDGSKKSAKITVSSGVLVEYLEVTSTLPTVEIPTEFVNEEEGTSEWINVPHHVLAKGKTNKLTTTIAPSNATNKTVLWSSSDESVVTVDKNGTIKGISAGTAYIDAFAESGYCGTRFYVVVTEPVTNVAIDWNNDLNAGVEIVESKGAITVPVGDVYADDATYIFLDSIISNANGIDADYPAEAIEWTVAGGNGIDSGWYEEHDDDGNLTLRKYVVAIFEAGKYTVTAKAMDGTNKSAKLTINAEQTVFDMRVEAPAGIGVNDYSDEFADVGPVWVTTAGTKFAPAVVFNYGDKDRQPSKAQQAYEIILEGDAASYLTVAGKNVTAKAVPENDRCLTSFTVKAGDFEETINVVILPKGEQPIVNREMVFNEADQRIVAAGSTVPVTTYINGKKGLPSGYKFVRWELKKFGEIEHDGEGGRVELIPVDSSLFSGKATSITFSENLEPMVPYTLIMVIADKNGMPDYIEKDIVITAKPKASDIKLREVEYEIVDDEYLLIKNVTDTYLTDYTKANPLTPADGIKVFAVETTENAIGYYEGVPYTFKLSNAKAAELFTELPGIYEATGDEAYFVAIDPNAAGSIKLTVTAGDFSKVSATLPFEIAKVDNPVKQIVTKATTYNVDIHDVIEIDFSLIGEKAGMDIAHTEVEWTVSAPDILSICDGSQYDPEGENYFAGYITTTGESGSLVLDGFSDKTGKVVITGTAMDGSNKSVKINVTVEKEKASGEDRLMLDVPANTPNGGEDGVAILTWGKTMKLNPTILATNPKGKAVSYEVFKVTEPYGDVVEGVPSEVTVDKNGTVKVGKYAINKKTGEEVIPYTGWIKVVGKLDYKQRSWNPETDMPGMMEIFDEVYIYVQQPATGLSVSYTENGESKTTTKAVNVTVPAGESITFTAEQLYGYAGGPDLEIGTPAWTMAANDFAYAYHPYDVDGEEYIEFKDMYTVDVREDAPVNKTFKIKAFTQDGSNKNIQITIKVGEPL